MKALIFFLCFGNSIVHAQVHRPVLPADRYLHDKLIINDNASTEYDFKRHELDWQFTQWDSAAYANVYAIEENGRLNLYDHGYNYKVSPDTRESEYSIMSFGINEEVQFPGIKLLVSYSFPFYYSIPYYCDSVYLNQYFLETQQLIPTLLGYMTKHENGKIGTFDIYENTMIDFEPPFNVISFFFLKFYYDLNDRDSLRVIKTGDFFNPSQQTDSLKYEWSQIDQILAKQLYTNDVLVAKSIYYYDGSQTDPYAIVNLSCASGPCDVSDSTFIEYTGVQDDIRYRYSGNPLFLTSTTEFITFGDTASIETVYNNIGSPYISSETRTSYDDVLRPMRILERVNDLSADTLVNSYLTVYEYPGISSTKQETSQFEGFKSLVDNDRLVIEFAQSFTGEIHLVAANGQVLRQINSSNVTQVNVILNALPAGAYFATIRRKQDQASFQFFYPGE